MLATCVKTLYKRHKQMHKHNNIRTRCKLLARLDFLKVVRLVFWSGVVGPGTNFRSLALRAHSRATRSKARLVSKSMARYKPLTTYPYLRGTSGADPDAPQRNRTTKELLILTAIFTVFNINSSTSKMFYFLYSY